MIAEGTHTCRVLSAKIGKGVDGSPTVEIRVEVTNGPSAGQRCEYVEKVNDSTAKFVEKSIRAVGWRGGSLGGIEADCARWVKDTGGESMVTVKHLTVRNGPRAGQLFDKVQAIGRVERVLEPIDRAGLAEADAAMRALSQKPPF
jgi:hypothetical protein